MVLVKVPLYWRGVWGEAAYCGHLLENFTLQYAISIHQLATLIRQVENQIHSLESLS
jgi:hypothetical protein